MELLWSWTFLPFFVYILRVIRKLRKMAGNSFLSLNPTQKSSLSPTPVFSYRPEKKSADEISAEKIMGFAGEREKTEKISAPKKLKFSGEREKRRPARLLIPEQSVLRGGERDWKHEKVREKDVEVEGCGFGLVSRKGRRQVLEDGYKVICNIFGDPKQALFGVFDGHGGREAVDFVVEKLAQNIVKALGKRETAHNLHEEAIRAGYLTTDKEFLSKGVRSGACVATAFLSNGELHVANAGDCRVVLSSKGTAYPLTSDHRVEREDERIRIENSGGFVDCVNGVWRIHGSLAVSRAIGDTYLKEWVIANPEINKLKLTPDCEFLIIASDGLWDKVTNQEAVDMVSTNKKSVTGCKKLVDISSSRGCKDDITIMVVDLKSYI
ncbi:probable protein phosphatase 2C 74 isoform X1 [Amborella trichopoda]|nr:probable protein phosphatase 2C 74 isoform X1 [Amborella trichopoda]|eukprot:XP_020518950.1 probable protein phosphatase 2C 74 isoform X1 [Amborella trichopoda]